MTISTLIDRVLPSLQRVRTAPPPLLHRLGCFAAVVAASCSFPRPADVGPDDDGGGPTSEDCQLTAIGPSNANTNDIVMIEGSFGDAVMVNFPGGASVAATVLGPHRARVMVPPSATAGDLTVASCGSTYGPLPFRRAAFALATGAFEANTEQASGARDKVVLETARESSSSIAIGARLYVIGGGHSNSSLISVEQASINADGSLGPFSKVSNVSLVTARRAHTTVTIGNNIYVIGGRGTGPLSGLERATIGPDGALNTFSAVTDAALTTARYGHKSVVIGNYLYVLGGFGNISLDSVERAIINADGSLGPFMIVSGVTLTMARQGHTAAVAGNYLYVIGGTRGNSILKEIERASINADGSLGPFAPVVSAALTTARSGHTTEVLGNYLYVLGGADSNGALNSVERAPLSDTGSAGAFSPVSGSILSSARQSHTSAVVGNYLYNIGGADSDSLNSVERANLNASGSLGAFVANPAIRLTKQRNSHSAMVAGNQLYVVGGSTAPNDPRTIDHTIINTDGSLGPFAASEVTTTAARTAHTNAIVGNYLYLVAGFGVNSLERAIIRADGSLGAFASVPGVALATARFAFTSVVSGSYLYILGGRGDNFEPLNSIEQATLGPEGSIGPFVTTPNANLATARYYHSTVQLRKFVYVIGGTNTTAVSNNPSLTSIERATVGADGLLGPFAPVPEVALVTGRYGHSTAVIGSYLYVIGGSGNTAIVNSIERSAIAPDGSLGPFEIVAGITLVTPRYSAATAVIGNYLYIIGGADYSSNLNSIERAALNMDGSLGAFVNISPAGDARPLHR